jgi:RNA polymerase sigma-70 factor (ECF subfamily)
MEPSFAATFEEEFSALHRYLRRRVRADVAEDLASQTFATAFSHWGRRDSARPVRPWLYGIAANLLFRHWRDEARMFRAYARTGTDPLADLDDGVDMRLDAQTAGQAAAKVLARMQRRDREIVLLHAWAELTDSEIAEALQIPVGTVKSRLHRARRRLRSEITRAESSGFPLPATEETP